MDHVTNPAGTGSGYAAGQLWAAQLTAATHLDPGTRRRAGERALRWASVLDGIAEGRIAVGSRTPVAGLPAWVTPEVVRGGFATGSAAAGGPLTPAETTIAARAGVLARREDVFAYCLSTDGVAGLGAVLDSGAYAIDVPEEGALLAVAWLARAGDVDGALDVLDAILPFAGRLRFVPRPVAGPRPDPSVVWRESAGDVGTAVARRRPHPRVETMREALTVWNPFADELLALWLSTDDRVAAVDAGDRAVDAGDRVVAVDAVADPDWRGRAVALLDRYRVLAAAHTLCGKHRNPKENLAILRAATQDALDGTLTPRAYGLLRTAVTGMVRRRGLPGSPRHGAVRAAQSANAAVPSYHAVARVLVARLAALPQDTGIVDVDALLRPVSAAEATPAAPEGAAVPDTFRRVLGRALAGTVEELVAARVVPSAEVLAGLVPQIAAATTAAPYRDDALRTLMAALYRAFRNRRSLLLLNLSSQVRLDELPWVRALARHRTADDRTRDTAGDTLRRLGELALDGFPATLLPNPFVRELAALSREAGLDLPWVEELAADIFEGRFAAKFLTAAKVAAGLLDGSVYARYYGIDYRAVVAIPTPARPTRGVPTSAEFDALCQERAVTPSRDSRRARWSVAANGVVIEQAQILTTHNLATLAGPVGAQPATTWTRLAVRAFHTAADLAGRLPANPRPLPMIKDVAYAWRHFVFFLSLPGVAADELVGSLQDRLAERPVPVQVRLGPALGGVAHAVAGGVFDADGTAGAHRRRLLGWTLGPHWIR